MTLQQAESYVKAYQQVLADDEKRGGRRSPSLLPTTKENLLRAIKLLVAQLHFIASDAPEHVNPLMTAAMFIDSFSDLPLDSLGYIDAMRNRRREIVEFHQELQNISRADRFYWQRIYALAGISCETKRTTFFENIRQRLGMGLKAEPEAEASPLGRKPVGRIVMD